MFYVLLFIVLVLCLGCVSVIFFFFFKQKTAYEMRIRYWSSDVCSSDLGKIVPRQGAKWRILSKIFANPHLPEIDDFYEPYTFEYEWLQAAPELQAQPTARPRSLLTGELLNKIEWSGNWEDMLGGEFEKRSH